MLNIRLLFQFVAAIMLIMLQNMLQSISQSRDQDKLLFGKISEKFDAWLQPVSPQEEK